MTDHLGPSETAVFGSGSWAKPEPGTSYGTESLTNPAPIYGIWVDPAVCQSRDCRMRYGDDMPVHGHAIHICFDPTWTLTQRRDWLRVYTPILMEQATRLSCSHIFAVGHDLQSWGSIVAQHDIAWVKLASARRITVKKRKGVSD